ncbi:MAG: hypothetical protein ACJ72X_12570 [Nitrososphaeraceae archaeon]
MSQNRQIKWQVRRLYVWKSMKKELLKKEGIKFQDDDNLRDFNICRMDFKKEIWMDTNET